jgi:hypothetical protein
MKAKVAVARKVALATRSFRLESDLTEGP